MTGMTHKERAIAALTGNIPDRVPTFELEFQLADEMFGKPLLPPELYGHNPSKLTEKEKDRLIKEAAEYNAYVYSELDYSIIPLSYVGGEWDGPKPSKELLQYVKELRRATGDKVLLTAHGDGTFAIPDGNQMYDFAYRLADDPEGLHEDARRMADFAIERNKYYMDAGVECLVLCSDYCYNSGPFISPKTFSEFITPYLAKIIKSARENGQYAIKHTDGNIMPIIDQLVDCNPHALHSLDPMAGVDIREVKRLYGDRVCLCGNVHCAAMQTGTVEDVRNSAEYCLRYGKPNGGYIFCTSNVPFKGMPADRYRLILDIWKQNRDY